MNDDDICECGDYRHSHKDGTGECLICRWSPSNPEQPCKEFRKVGEDIES